jgi:hypothetical protein
MLHREGVLLLAHQWESEREVSSSAATKCWYAFTGWIVQAIGVFNHQRQCRVCARYLLTSLARSQVRSCSVRQQLTSARSSVQNANRGFSGFSTAASKSSEWNRCQGPGRMGGDVRVSMSFMQIKDDGSSSLDRYTLFPSMRRILRGNSI